MNTQRGQRDKLEKYLDTNQEIEVCMSIAGAAEYDFACFGLDMQEISLHWTILEKLAIRSCMEDC